MKYAQYATVMLGCMALSSVSYGEDIDLYNDCVNTKLESADDARTVGDIRQECSKAMAIRLPELSEAAPKLGPITRRILAERKHENSRYVLIPHKRNYLLPYIYTNNLDRSANASDPWSDKFKHYEAKFQLSYKVPLTRNNIFRRNDALYAAFTVKSWWQVYANEISKPFRATNYQPEIYYITGTGWHPFGGNTGLIIGMEHESNGRRQPLSRSWNRAYINFLYEVDNFALSLRPWYRLPEPKKRSATDPKGDDNPSINDSMGRFDLNMLYRWDDKELGLMVRNNLKFNSDEKNKGAVELTMSFPLFGNIRGYLEIFEGYGESLIEYDIKQRRVGLGILLTDLL